MSPGSDESLGMRMKKESEARLLGLVAEGESVIAAGTAEELVPLEPDLGSGTGWTFLWFAWGTSERPVLRTRTIFPPNGPGRNARGIATRFSPLTTPDAHDLSDSV